ncbi:MAG: leucyl/phenylalanyl-tRNA--protein transferase [Burkholderiales bacterium]|nr:leucyl/phenylalanyl-tRNA--protein transferase [Burkholderiales bacterium]
MIPWLGRAHVFPPLESALPEPNGLLAAGGDLSPARILAAYRHGIFPWFGAGDPILWWSPDPRMVLYPAELKVSRSLRKALRRGDYEIRVDTRFRDVMHACAQPRAGQPGTWIVDAMIDAYCRLAELGYAHSVETWRDGELIGGLYGMAIGRAFFGESMFSRAADASKLALVHLVRQLERWQFGPIDCQMRTSHLASLGAREISRASFSRRLEHLVHYPQRDSWTFDRDLAG